ncbi:cyclic-phosphate processing receiver domain-containing protein [Undibacterium sp. WLHG33]|uniref:cyclic-phosphate processing receiver domain-containing protein n=1 Tax=Undibacterium sp. WLHG33 TaxID=3412482 RepID=UPI003C2BB7DD
MIDSDSKASSDPILDEEDKEWLNMAPIGREFGSKDYERLMAHDNLVDIARTSSDPASLALRVFLDDERATPEGWVRTYWPDEVIDLLETNAVAEVSLDHDLGNDQRGTGYDVVVWIEEAVALRGFIPPKITVHSANSSAREKMEAGIRAIDRLSKT